MNPARPLNLQFVLRVLIVIEVAWMVWCAVFWGTFEEQLPTALREYEHSRPSGVRGGWVYLLAGGSALHLLLVVAAWIALWCGWRHGRLLYTLNWLPTLVLLPFEAPYISVALEAILGSVSLMVGGMIFGLLYFSDLRNTYAGKARVIRHETPPSPA